MKFKEMTLVQIWDKMKKPFNFAWRAGVIVIAVGMICGLFSEFMEWLWRYAEGDSYETEYLSENVKAKYYTDGTCRLYERYGDKNLSKKLKFVDFCPMTDDTLTSYQALDGKWGFLSTLSGKIVIPAIYDRIEMISRDMITASLGIENVESVVFDINGRQHK